MIYKIIGKNFSFLSDQVSFSLVNSYNPRKDAIIEIINNNLEHTDWIHSHSGYECDTCGLIPDVIYSCWLKDFGNGTVYDIGTNKTFLRNLCYDCCERIFKSPGYFSQYLQAIRSDASYDFPEAFTFYNLLFVAKYYFILEVTDE